VRTPADLWLEHWLVCKRCHHHARWAYRSKVDHKCPLGRELQSRAVAYLRERYPQAFKDYQAPPPPPQRKWRLNDRGEFVERWE
jgi:hypothetical protein